MAFRISDVVNKSSSSSTTKKTPKNLTKEELESLLSGSNPVPKKANWLDNLGMLLSAASPLQEFDKAARGKETGVGDYLKNFIEEAGKGLVGVGTFGAINPTTEDFVKERSSADAASRLLGKAGVKEGPLKTGLALAADIVVDPSTYLTGGVLGGAKGVAKKVVPGVVKLVSKNLDTLVKAGKATDYLSAAEKLSTSKKFSNYISSAEKATKIGGGDAANTFIKYAITEDIVRSVETYGSKSKWFKQMPELKTVFSNVVGKTKFTADDWAKLSTKQPGLYASVPFTNISKKLIDYTPAYEKIGKLYNKFAPESVREAGMAIKKGVDSVFKPVIDRTSNKYLKTVLRQTENMMNQVKSNAVDFIAPQSAKFASKIIGKGYTKPEIIAAMEVSMGRGAKINTRVFPRVKELVKNSEFQEMMNFYNMAMKDTPRGVKELGIRPIEGYILRQFKTRGGSMAIPTDTVPTIAGTLKGSMAKRTFRTYGQAYEYAQKYGLNLSDDVPFLMAEGYTRGHQALALSSMYSRVASSDFVKSAKTYSKLKSGDEYVKVARVKAFKGKVVKKEIADVINNYRKLIGTDEGAGVFLRMYDKIQNLFKRSVTVWWPAFLSRNTINNVYVNMIAGNNNPANWGKALDVFRYGKALEAGKDVTKWGNKKIGDKTVKEMWELARQNKVYRAGFIEQDSLAKTAKGLLDKPKKVFQPFVKYQKIMGDLNEASEVVSRMSLFIDGINKGMLPTEASVRVKKFLFNYDELTNIEKNAFKRVIPFYTFMSNNIKLHVDMLLKDPQIMRYITKTTNAFGTDTEDFPDWTGEYMGVDLSKLPFVGDSFSGDKDNKWFSPGAGLSTEAMNTYFGRTPKETLMNLVQSSSPLIKVPLYEVPSGMSSFKGTPIEDDTNGSSYRLAPKAIKEFMEYREEKFTGDDGKEVTISYVNPWKKYWLNTVMGRSISTGRDTGELFEGGSLNSQELLPILLGIRTYQFNIPEERERKRRAAEQRTIKELQVRGLARKYTQYYIPRSEEEGVRAILDKYGQK